MPYFKFDGIERLLRRAYETMRLEQLIRERDKVADDLGVPLTQDERAMLRVVSDDTLRRMLEVMGDQDGPLARPRPFAPMPRDTLTRGIRPKD